MIDNLNDWIPHRHQFEIICIGEVIKPVSTASSSNNEKPIVIVPQCEIKEKDMVTLKSNPEMKGMVFAVSEIGVERKYDVFIDGHINSYYYEQLNLVNDSPEYQVIDIQALQSWRIGLSRCIQSSNRSRRSVCYSQIFQWIESATTRSRFDATFIQYISKQVFTYTWAICSKRQCSIYS